MVRLASVLHQGSTKLVAVIPFNAYYCDLTSIASNARDFFQTPDSVTRANTLIEECASTESSLLAIPVSDCELLSPIDGSLVGKLLCIGMNYVDHCTEQNVDIPTEPLVFSKFGSCVVGPDDPVICESQLTQKLDYEVELAVVVGKKIPKGTPKEGIANYVGGYTVIHDVSARDWQLEKNGGQWLLGKAMDGYAPIGPVIVTSDDAEMSLEKVHTLGIRCRVNGETLQESNTDQLVFKVDDILAWLSRFMTLLPGDVIATGTPPGVGCFRNPPRWLQPGDLVECEIDGIGTLKTPIVGPNGEGAASAGGEGEAEVTTTTPISAVQPTTPTKLPLLASSSGLGKLAGMTAIVTGAARGLGYGIAAKLGKEGVSRVAIVDLDPTLINEACQGLSKLVPNCTFVGYPCDVTDSAAVDKTWATIVGANGNGKIDILVQAAGIVGKTGIKTQDVDPNNFNAVFQVNVNGIFNGCKSVLPYMKAKNYGRIVNIASIAGKEGNAGKCTYVCSSEFVTILPQLLPID